MTFGLPDPHKAEGNLTEKDIQTAYSTPGIFVMTYKYKQDSPN